MSYQQQPFANANDMKTLLKNRRVNIRISAIDLEGLKAKAAAEGLPYQTMMASVLRKYVSGRLVDGPARLAGRSSGRQVSALPRSFELASTQYSAPSGTVTHQSVIKRTNLGTMLFDLYPTWHETRRTQIGPQHAGRNAGSGGATHERRRAS